MIMIDIEQQLSKSNEWLDSCSMLIDGLPFDGYSKNIISVSLAQLCIEHNSSINLLVQKHNYGSAFALVRLQLEACVRSIWFYHCAKENEIKSFLCGGDPPKIQPMIDAIETIDGYTEKQLSAIKSKVWKNLNGFTHGGDFQVKSRINTTEVVSNYANEHVTELIHFSTKISLISATTISWVANNAEIGSKLLESYKSIYPDQFV
jgi:hypothetical protein